MAERGFRLQPLLEHKRQLEEQKTLELAALAAEAGRVRDGLEALQGEEQAHLDTLQAIARDGALDPHRYEAAQSYLRQLEQAIEQQTARLAEVSSSVEARRDELMELLKEKRSLERLRERHDAEAAVEEARREARRVDDVTSSRYVRRRSEGTP